jgi:hypothetical protein
MRKFVIPLLMASVLMPAAAQAQREDRGDRPRAERGERNENSSNDRPQRSQRSESSNNDGARIRVERAERPARMERSVEAQSSEPVRVRRFEQQQVAEPVQQAEPLQQVRRTERRRARDGGGFVGAIRRAGDDQVASQNGGIVTQHDRDRDRRWDGRRDGDRRWDGNRDGHRRWSGDWRRDNRYNWYSYRNRYSSLFRLGRYYDPYRYGYRRFSIGFSLWPSYYGSNYWLNDPWQYRLPPAYGPYRWVRYYDDALLVNIYTGEVADVVYNFFW